jgi:type IV pilus assembly protein PilO
MMLRVLLEIVRQRRRQLLFIGALVLVGIIAYFTRILLLQEQLVSARREWSNQRTQVKQKSFLGKAEQYDTWVRDYALFAARIPPQRDFARIISDLFETAENNSLSVGSVTYKPEKSRAGYLEYTITLDLTGTYGGIKSFLADINQARDLITINTLGLSKSGKLFEEEVKLRVSLGVLFGMEAK